MSNNPAISLASAIQSASINRHPSPHHDINPSTAASRKIPVELHSPPASSHSDDVSLSSDIVSPSNMIPQRRRTTFPPLPDFRFEQSYLASIKDADTWGKVAYITIKDQVILPLVQGTVWTLILSGWRFWNRGAKFQGQTLGSKIRRWWWQVNNWELPKVGRSDATGKANDAKDFYANEFSNTGFA